VHAPAESKDDEVKDSFYEVHIWLILFLDTTLLEDFNAKVRTLSNQPQGMMWVGMAQCSVSVLHKRVWRMLTFKGLHSYYHQKNEQHLETWVGGWNTATG
jgi:hypothetical protein